MTNARPTAASAAEMAIEKIATITPVYGCGGGAKRQNAMKFKFAAASIISIPIRMKIACRRLNAASRPMENRAADTIRKPWSVGVIASQRSLGSACVSHAGFGVAPKQSFLWGWCVVNMDETEEKFAIARPRSPARGTRALPMGASSLFLHHEHKRAD